MQRPPTPLRPPALAALAALACAGAGAFAQDAPAAPPATVNGREIPAMAVDNVARQLEADGGAADRGTILEELVDMEVLAQAAERAGLDERPAIATALRLQRMQTLANAWLADVGERLEITEDELRDEYARQATGLLPDEFRASHLLLATEAEARAAIAALERGADFAALAARDSLDGAARGGALGWISRGAVDDALIDALEALEPGAVAPEPVRTGFGFHVLRLDEARAASPPAFTAVREGLRDIVLRRRLAERVEALRAEADVALP